MPDLTTLRSDIDQLNRELERLLIKRFALVKQVAAHKARTQQPVCDPQREAAILAQLGQRTPELQPALQAIFQTIMAQSRTLEQTLLTKEEL
ncbi:chorismate mutase [Limosilactobacillus ingluviei]|uniref:chorismate mutase n=1 Tax=Limosilactobacillus ingluviei TaxID=148604 RepID=UPI0023F21D4E|nr:chorismate mutase [Limosilactobacillus ingluviei]